MTTTLKCPACNESLIRTESPDAIYLYCAQGKCPSVEANNGANGKTVEEAFENLESKVLNEGKL